MRRLSSVIGLSDYDDFRHIESDYSLVGRRSGRTFRIGDKVLIKVIAANLEKRQLDYEWVINAGKENDEEDAPKNKKNSTNKKQNGPK